MKINNSIAFIVLILISTMVLSRNSISVKPVPLPIVPPHIQTINNGQTINFTVQPYESKIFKIWIPTKAAHLKINYLHQLPNVYMFTNSGSTPIFGNGEQPDCEIPSYTNELLSIPFIFNQCNFERPESGQYHYIRITSENSQPTVGLNQLYVRFQPNGLSQVAQDIHMNATFVEWHSQNNTITKTVYNNSGDSDHFLDSLVNMKFDESLGLFEERPGGTCDAGTGANPTYLKLEIFHSEPMDGCYFRGSWDDQAVQCSPQLLQILNTTQQAHIINTDEYKTRFVGDQCLPDVGNYHMEAGNVGVPIFHWFEFTAVIRGQSYPRRFNIRKVNDDF